MAAAGQHVVLVNRLLGQELVTAQRGVAKTASIESICSPGARSKYECQKVFPSVTAKARPANQKRATYSHAWNVTKAGSVSLRTGRGCLRAMQAADRGTGGATTLDKIPPSLLLIKQGHRGEESLRVHDPCVMRAQNGDLYMFGTGKDLKGTDGQIPYWRASTADLSSWEFLGCALAARPVSAKTIDWAKNPKADTFWAPEVAFFNGRYFLYYAYSIFGTNQSAIGLMSTERLDTSPINWQDGGLVVQSPSKVGKFNAIDPGVLTDAQGRLWLSWGSFWGGIFVQELNPLTGLLLDPKAKPVNIASRPDVRDNPLEGATIVYRKANNAYYVFIAWDYCCPERKVFDQLPYRVVVGRSTSGPLGPYVDRANVSLLKGGGTPLVLRDAANVELPSIFGPNQRPAAPGSCCFETLPPTNTLGSNGRADGFITADGGPPGAAPTRAWKGFGGVSVLLDQADRPDLVAGHAYLNGKFDPCLRIFELGWDGDQWPFMKWTTGDENRRQQPVV